MVDAFQLTINIMLTCYALIVTVIFSLAWRKRKDLIYWFIALMVFSAGHFILIFQQEDIVYELIGNGVLIAATLILIVSTFIEYINIMIIAPDDPKIVQKEKIFLIFTVISSILLGITAVIVLQILGYLDLLVGIAVLLIVMLIPLSIYNIRIYYKQRTLTRLFMIIIFGSGTLAAFSSIFSLFFPWGIAMNIAMDFVFITLLMTGAIAAPIEQRIAQSEDKYRKLSEQLEIMVDERTYELALVNAELESFSYSVSHDLRAPLRSIEGFTKMLKEELSDILTERNFDHLERIINNTTRMNELIQDLLSLAHVSRSELKLESVNLSDIAYEIMTNLVTQYSENKIDFTVQENLTVDCDQSLIRIVLVNLLSNAVKFSKNKPNPKIEFSSLKENDQIIFFVKDNGVGFDMNYSNKLFGTFQRLHKNNEFEGTGIGLVTVKRIIDRHKGKIWAEAEVDKGATFYFVCGDY